MRLRSKITILFLLFISVSNAFSYRPTKEIELKIKWLDANIESPYFYNKLMETYSQIPDTQASIELLIDYVNLIQDAKSKHGVYQKIAALSEMVGEIQQAQRFYQVAYFADPANADFLSLFYSAYLLFQMGEFSNAINQLEILTIKSKDNVILAKSTLLLSMVYYLDEKLEDSEKQFKKAIAMYNKDYHAFNFFQNSFISWYHFNTSYLKTGNLNLKHDIQEFSKTNYKAMLSFSEFLIYQLKLSSSQYSEYKSAMPDIDEGQIMIQVASYTNKANAEAMIERLQGLKFNVITSQKMINNSIYHRVYVIPEDENNVEKTIMDLKQNNLEGFLVN